MKLCAHCTEWYVQPFCDYHSVSDTDNIYVLFGRKEIAHSRKWLSFTNLRLPEFGEIGADVETDSFGCSGERDATYQQNGQQDIGEQGCEVHHLQCNAL